MKEISAILKSVEHVPPFPEVVLKATALLEDPEVPASELLEVIQYDPIITMRVLHICNSAAFGLRREVESLQQALVMLGNHQMMKILVTSGALDFLRGEHPGYGLDKGELWEHAMACALMSQILLRRLERAEDHALFTGALLHDVGKIVLSEYSGEKYREILHEVWDHERSGLEAEREVLGIDHAQVGKVLAERWQFPSNIVTMIERHHGPIDPVHDALSLSLTHLANLLCLQMGIGVGDRGLASRSAPKLMEALGWSNRNLDLCIHELAVELEQVRELLGLGRSKEA